jgi:RNA polymerase sigma-70 factor, ECF subfamily
MDGLVERALAGHVLPRTEPMSHGPSAVYAAHADLVWVTLQRFGVSSGDLEDAFQDVFIVVQKKLPQFDGANRLSSWLFAICRRVASTHRRKARKNRERTSELGAIDVADSAMGPERLAETRQAQAQLARVLDGMDLDRRAVFVMFEMEDMPCDEIAAIVGVPVGTVYSRLHAARKEFAKLLEQDRARAEKGGRR